MSLARSRQPGDRSHLERWLSEWAGAEGVTAGRLRRRVAVLVVSAMLDNQRDEEGRHRFVVKGGAALELRFGARARTSKDLDAVYRGVLDDAAGVVADAVAAPWNGFTGRVTRLGRIDAPGPVVPPVRFEIKLAFKGKPFATLPMEVSAPEGQALASVDAVAVSLEPVGLPAPEFVSCLSVRYQVAQKLHACTDQLDGVRPNDRAHDLADLILLEELLAETDLADARSACVEIFTGRARQPWPPALVAPPHWARLWAALVDEERFPVEHLDEAVSRVRALIGNIEAARY